MGTTDNSFNNSGEGEQNIAQGDRAIGKQENITQDVKGDRNIVLGTGDAYVEQHIHQPRPPVIPYQLSPLDACFLGRDEELAALLEQLQPGKVVAVCGPGGMGKSALAAQAVHKLEKDRFPDGIISHSFYGYPQTKQALQAICAAFGVTCEDIAIIVRQILSSKKALIILDGAEEADDLPAILRLRGTCGVLITSRKKDDAQSFRLDLKSLDEQPAAEVFCEHSGAALDDKSVQSICKILDGWPVGLRIAGRYCSSTGESAADYLQWLEKEPLKELGDGEHQEENAALLLRRSVAQVSEDARLALGVAGSLAFEPIAREPVAAILEGNERRARKTLGELVNYGLLEKQEEGWQISHVLIYTYARTELTLSRKSLKRLAGYYIDFWEEQSEVGSKGYSLLDSKRMHCMYFMKACLNKGLWKEVVELAKLLDSSGTNRTIVIMRWTAVRQLDERKDEAWCLKQLGNILYMQYSEKVKALFYLGQSLTIYRELGDEAGQHECMEDIRNINLIVRLIAGGEVGIGTG